MLPLSQLLPRHRVHTLSQPPRPSTPSGLPKEVPFSGVLMGISMPPLVQGASPAAASGWAAQLGVQAPRGTDAESIARSAGEQHR